MGYRNISVILLFPLIVILLINNILLLSKGKTKYLVTTDPAIHTPLFSDNTADADSETGTGKILGVQITASDGREDLLKNFMKNSPMLPYTSLLISEADKLDMDYRIVPAIAMCESNLGTRIPSSDSHNAWGIAVYTGQQEGAKFQNWEAAIKWVFNYIHEKYISKDIIDVKDIGSIWAPPSVEKGHSWAFCVESFMRSIE